MPFIMSTEWLLQEIKNLEQLTLLENLWLGKNKITTIQNLDTLVNLRKLSLQVILPLDLILMR